MNHKDQKYGEFSFNERISNALLIFLLLVRLADQYLPIWIFGPNPPDWFRHWYAGIAYMLTAMIIWLNRHRLAAINVDRPFIAAMLLGGFLYALYLIPAIGMLVGITAGLIFWCYQTNQLVFKNPNAYSKATWLLVLLTIPLALVPVLIFPLQLKASLDFDIFFTTLQGILIVELASIAFEEVLFRGALWAYTRSLGLSEQATLYILAFLFWISHHRMLFSNPYPFWVSLPIEAVLLGFITWRSKSLTPSLSSHFLFNLVGQLLLTIYK